MLKRIVALIPVGTAIAVAASFHPLNVKTGTWHMTVTTTWTGLPSELGAEIVNGSTHSYQACVRPQDLSTNPWSEGSDEKCKWTVLNSTGTDMEVRGTSCGIGRDYGMTSEVHGKIHVINSENGIGSFDITMTGNGRTVTGHASYTGKWVESSCHSE